MPKEIPDEFREELTLLINKHSLDNVSHTPDFILSQYLCECLETYNRVQTARRMLERRP